jgi:hypothetical protein
MDERKRARHEEQQAHDPETLVFHLAYPALLAHTGPRRSVQAALAGILFTHLQRRGLRGLIRPVLRSIRTCHAIAEMGIL